MPASSTQTFEVDFKYDSTLTKTKENTHVGSSNLARRKTFSMCLWYLGVIALSVYI